MSVKVPPKGTRGTRFPRFLSGLLNGLMVRQFRRGGMRTQGGLQTLMLVTVGAKSGGRRHAVLGYLEESPSSWIVVASMAGSAHNPAWLHNLAKWPDATVEFEDGRRVDIRAETLEGEDLDRAWDRIGRDAPEYVTYLSKTDRTMSVIRLRQRA